MSESEKDNNDFEFIKEQVIEKRSKKYKKWIPPFLMTAAMGALFGIVASLTFCIAEPRIYHLLNNKEKRTLITIPSKQPADKGKDGGTKNSKKQKDAQAEEKGKKAREQKPVIVEKTINADIADYQNMYNDIKSVAYAADKSLAKISMTEKKDLFGSTVDRKVETTGLIIANVNSELLVLVSLDRVQNAGDILVNISDQVSVKAKLRDYEKDINLAVIAASLKDVPDALLNNIVAANFGESYTLSVGSPVIALGSPNGHPDSMEVGIITSRDISVSVTDNQLDLFNTSINDNEDSDGIIVNMNGEVIGLITRTLKEDVNKGLSTAIGISKVKEIIEKMGNQEPRIYFGIKAEDMTGDAMKVHHVENGIYVDDVKGDSPALDGGIKSGDIILRVNKEDVLNISNFNTIISAYQPGKKVTVRIKRTSASKEKEMNIKVVLAERGYKKD